MYLYGKENPHTPLITDQYVHTQLKHLIIIPVLLHLRPRNEVSIQKNAIKGEASKGEEKR